MKQATSQVGNAAANPEMAAPGMITLKDILARPGAKESWDQFLEDSLSFSKRYADLLESYPDEFIAFYKGEVHARGRSRDEVVRIADAKELPRNGLIVRFMESTSPPLFLPSLFL